MQNPFKLIKPFVVKHEPEILMGMGISGLIFSTIWAIKATFKAAKTIDDYKQSKQIEKITPKEVIKLTWKYYWPVAASTALSIPCIIAGNRVSNRRYTALAAAYTISETALQEYQEATKNIVGEKKAKQIQEEVNEKALEKTYKGANQVIIASPGDSDFYESQSGHYFTSNWNKIIKAQNELNASVLAGSGFGQITLNEWLRAIGAEECDAGDILGWDLREDPNYLIDCELSSHVTKDMKPCGVITYRNRPKQLNWSNY